MIRRSWILLLASALSCAKGEPTPVAPTAPPEHSDEPEHEELPRRVRISEAIIEAAHIRWAPVRREVLEAELDLPGEITPDPDRMARVSVTAEGRLDRISFREGDRVKKGELLAVVKVLNLPEKLASLAALSSRARAARAQADRLGALAQKGLAGAQEVENAEAEAEALAAEVKGESEHLGALGTDLTAPRTAVLEVRAPISGTVVERNAVLGDRAGPDHPLATIVDLDEVWFLGRVFERDLASVKIGDRAVVELNAFPQERFDGSVEYVAEQIDPVARTIVARVRLANKAGPLRLGLFGTARVAVGAKKAAPSLVVPRSAITDLEGKPSVFVRQADGDFERHEVVLGEASLGKVEISAGLREGEVVVTEGVFTLKSAVLKATFGEED